MKGEGIKMDKIKGYKAMNKDMTCRDFQYEVGKIYEQDESPSICDNGFHFCENPLDTLNYYDLNDCVFTEVESLGKIDRNSDEDTKISTNKIKINAKLDLSLFIKASFNFIWNKCKIEKTDSDNIKYNEGSSQVATSGDSSKVATSGNYSKVATSGNYSKVATSGNYSKVATSGNYSKVATSGYYSKVATSGGSSQVATSGNSSKVATSGNYSKVATSGGSSKVATSGDYSQVATSGKYSQVATSGYYSQVATSGYSSQVATSGDYSQVATSGYYSQVATSGDSSKVEINGKYGIGANIGYKGKSKGIKGTWLVLAEYDRNKEGYYFPKNVKCEKVDGIKIKEDTFYILKDNEFCEVNND